MDSSSCVVFYCKYYVKKTEALILYKYSEIIIIIIMTKSEFQVRNVR